MNAPLSYLPTSIDIPWTRLANATPHRTDTIQDDAVWATSHPLRQASVLICLRHSMAQMRTIRHTRTRTSARYMPENMVAYHSGKAAKVAPPAVRTHTSFPSQWGPMVFSARRRSFSDFGRILSSIPTPNPKPSKAR